MKTELAELILDADRLRKRLNYNMCTGEFRYRDGRPAGCKKRTYIVISVENVLYRAHRLAWLWMTGEWPREFIDHINLDKHDNRFFNLRLATKSQNMANRPKQKNNSSGFKGVHHYRAGEKYGKPWQAGIIVNKKRIYLGQFPTKELAHAAYKSAAQKFFGEFGRA
jgi:hypothetical protein